MSGRLTASCGVTDRYRLLWVDFKISTKDAESIGGFSERFDIHEHQAIHSLDREIEMVAPDVICLDYDFPTKASLKALPDIKQKHPSVPILMLTVQHSEALAVWAFRSRVWDYLVKPISNDELRRCLEGLCDMLELRAAQKVSRAAASHSSVIPEDNRWRGAGENSSAILAPAIEYVENSYRDKISSTEAARLCNLTTFQLSRMFKETYNLTFQDYIMRFRIREACRLLQNPAADIGDVGSLVGFNDPSYFARVFRRYLHCSPSQFHSGQHDELVQDLLSPEAVEDTATSTGLN